MVHLFVRPVPPELLEQLPWWVGYASLVSITLLWTTASLLLGGIGAGIASLPLSGSRGEPWHARARQAYSLRVLLAWQMMIWPVIALILSSVWPLPLAFSSLALRCFPPALASLTLLAVLRFAIERRILGGRHSMWQLACSAIVYHFTLGQILLVVALMANLAMPWRLTWSVPVIGVVVVAVMLFFLCGGSLPVLRVLRLLTPANDRLRRVVATAAAQVGTPVPITYIARMPAANAFAFPWNGRLAFSEGILSSLNDEQLGSIAAHEICHLGMPAAQKIMRVGHALALFIPFILLKPVFGQFGTQASLPFLVSFLVVIFLLQILGRRLMRREEERADRAGAEANEAVYALALEQIYRENLMPANARSPQGHPPLYDRMVSSGVTPAYEKPSPPPVWIRHLAMLAQFIVFLGLVVFLVVAYAFAQALAPNTVESQTTILATAGGPLRDVSHLGELHIERGDDALGLSLLEYAQGEAPRDIEVLARLARGYALRGRCEEASDMLEQAERQMQLSPWRQSDQDAVDAAARAIRGCQ